MLNEFISFLNSRVGNSIYCWGAQGEVASEALINAKETSWYNKYRAIKFLNTLRAQGIQDIRAYDCSGLGMNWLYNQTKTIGYDTTADGLLRNFTTPLDRLSLKRGDWVFRVSSGRAYHIGYIVDNDLSVVEAYGRDRGVIKRGINASGSTYWNVCGRPKMFAAEIEYVEPSFSIDRELKFSSPYMKGEDVRTVQTALSFKGFATGAADGIFGQKTYTAVRSFQFSKKLTVDGIVGEATVVALGGKWTKATPVEVCPYNKPTVIHRNNVVFKGNDAFWCQWHLIRLGYDLVLDGIAGAKTWAAIHDIQAKRMGVVGSAGVKTYAVLEK